MLDPGPAPPRRLRYIVIPHPDDEFSAWSMVQRRPDLYMVFVLLTHGELTTFGDGHGLQEHLGERVPQPQPFTGAGTWRLRGQRLDSWHAFLDSMASLDATLDVPVRTPSPSSSFELFVGARSARVVFDVGDGTVTPAAVTEAVHKARELRRVHLPVHEELDIVAAGYWNRDDPASLRYVHRDHQAVHQALWAIDHGLPGPQWGRTTHGDPDAAARGITTTVDPDLYEAAMAVAPPPADPAVNPGARRSGVFQQCYAWLQDAYWAAGERDDASIFSRAQTFWARFGA